MQRTSWYAKKLCLAKLPKGALVITLAEIWDTLDGREWNADTTAQIAEMIRTLHLPVADPAGYDAKE